MLTDGGVVHESRRAVAETLLEGKEKEEFCEKIITQDTAG